MVEGVIDLLNTLDDLEKPIYFVPGEFGDQMDEDYFPCTMFVKTNTNFI